jgi:PAS domain S-box-containing protein
LTPSHTDLPSAQSLLDAAPDAVITIDSEGTVVQFNRAAEMTFGYARDDALGGQLAELVVPPDVREAHRSALARVAAGGSPRILDTRVQMPALRADGSEIPVEVTVTQSERDPVRFTAWIRDLSGTRATQAERARSVGVRAAERMTDVGTWTWNTESDELILSENAYALLGLEPRLAPRLALTAELRHPEDRERVDQALEQTRHTGALSIEYRIIRPDGHLVYVRQGASVLEWDGGRPVRIVGTMQDITGRHLAEREILAHCAVAEVFGAWRGFDEGVLALLSGLGTAMEWESGATWVVAGDALACRAFWPGTNPSIEEFESASRKLRLTRGTGLVGRAWATKEPIVLANPSQDAGFLRRRVADLAGIRGAVAFPAIYGDEVLAVCEFHTHEARLPTAHLTRTLAEFGREIGQFLDRHRGQLTPTNLTPRQLEVLQLAARGLPGPQIATELFITRATVKTHLSHIYETLGVSDRAGAVAKALRLGLIE